MLKGYKFAVDCGISELFITLDGDHICMYDIFQNCYTWLFEPRSSRLPFLGKSKDLVSKLKTKQNNNRSKKPISQHISKKKLATPTRYKTYHWVALVTGLRRVLGQ